MKKKNIALTAFLCILTLCSFRFTENISKELPDHIRNKSERNKSDYIKQVPTMEFAPNPIITANPQTNLRKIPERNGLHDAESMRIKVHNINNSQIDKSIVKEHNSLDYIDKKNMSPELKLHNDSNLKSFGAEYKSNIFNDQKYNLDLSAQVPQNFKSSIRRRDNLPLDYGLVITRNNNNTSAVFDSDGYISGSAIPNIINYRTYRNMGVLLDFDYGTSYAYVFSSTHGDLGYETNVKDYIVGGNLSLIRNQGNRVYIYKTDGYVGWLDGIVDYTVGHNIAILKKQAQVLIYSFTNNTIGTLNIPSAFASIKAGDNIAVVSTTTTGLTYIYSQNSLMGTENNISDYDVGGNMAIVRSSNNTAYIYSDSGYQGQELNILDYEAGGDMSILRNNSNTSFTYKYNGFLFSDGNVIEYKAGDALATILKSNNVAYTYKFNGYYLDSNVRDFAVGGSMAVVRFRSIKIGETFK